jgi:L-ribulose-5-phosphate 4-epimerase
VILELYGPGGLDPWEAPGALVASHGPFAWGETASAAVETAGAIELIAQFATGTLVVSPDQPPIEQPLLDRHFSRKHGPQAYYGQP